LDGAARKLAHHRITASPRHRVTASDEAPESRSGQLFVRFTDCLVHEDIGCPVARSKRLNVRTGRPRCRRSWVRIVLGGLVGQVVADADVLLRQSLVDRRSVDEPARSVAAERFIQRRWL
jgi:hypothetical protein